MPTCKECLHENVCVIIAIPDAFENTKWDKAPCDHFKDKSIELPCKVGDTVYCDIENRCNGNFVDECIVSHIEFDQHWNEPLFTLICREKAAYQTFWLSEFGKLFFREPQFAEKKTKRKGVRK